MTLDAIANYVRSRARVRVYYHGSGVDQTAEGRIEGIESGVGGLTVLLYPEDNIGFREDAPMKIPVQAIMLILPEPPII